MTMEDIGNLRVNQLEDLLQGMSENAKEMERQMKNGESGKGTTLEGDDALNLLIHG